MHNASVYELGALRTNITLHFNIIMHIHKYDRIKGWKTSSLALITYVQMNQNYHTQTNKNNNNGQTTA